MMNKSYLGKKWLVNSGKPSAELIQHCQNPLIAKILLARDIKTAQEASYYIGKQKPAFSSYGEIPQIDLAIERIERAIAKQEQIVIYGDYDVDGTTSTALMVSALKLLGAQVSFFIPNRFTDGYGLNSKAVLQIKSRMKAKLLITCDCGITNFEEVKLAQSFGLDVIVTDHHSLPEVLPPAVAVLNPKLLPAEHALHWLPGVGVAYKLAEALLLRANKGEAIEPLLDFVALGMIADLAPLRAENRLLVIDGLKVLANTQRPGLKALLLECGLNTDEESVGFAIGPRINAAGRLQDANQAVKLFLAEDPLEAQMLAKQLSEQNLSRQGLCDEIFQQAVQKIEREVDLDKARVLMLADGRWHHGVVGIVASRLVEKYHLPAFVAVEEENSIKGSARGISAIDLFVEISKHAHLLSKFGGHKAAAGFSLDKNNWPDFANNMQQELARLLNSDDLQATLSIDVEVAQDELGLTELEPLWALSPFGMGFSKPVFTFAEPITIKEIQPLGKGQEHTKLLLQNGAGTFEAVQWRVPAQEFQQAKQQGKIQLAFTPSKRSFNGRTYLQLEIKDWMLVTTQFPSIPRAEPPCKGELSFIKGKESTPEIVQIEASEKFKTSPEIIDKRSSNDHEQSLHEVYKQGKTFVFAEGKSINSLNGLSKEADCLINREKSTLEKCDSLVLWSLPLENNVLQKLLTELKPEKIFLYGVNLTESWDTKNFLRELLGLLRMEKQAEVEKTLSNLASSTNSSEDTCQAGLQILAESGILSFKIEDRRVKINMTGSPKKVNLDTEQLQGMLQRDKRLKDKLLTEPLDKLKSHFN